MEDTFAMIAVERRQLVGEMRGWTDEQWCTPSLCGSWTVREVAAHLITPFTVSTPRFMMGFVTSLFSFDKASDHFARGEAQKPIVDIIDTLERNADSRFTPPGSGAEAPLTDVIVHGQDMRRPLGLTHRFEPAHLVRALDFVKGGAFGFVPRGRVAGLRFVATDLDWSAGPHEGVEITGPGEALLLAITGREVALADLEGPGVSVLGGRLG